MDNLQFYRNKKKELKLTNDDISQISGIPKRTVEDFFRGASQNPRIDTVQSIEKALGIETNFQWSEKDKELGIGADPTYLSEHERKWLRLRSEVLREMGEDYLNTLTTMIEGIIKK